MELRWSPKAADDLERIFARIQKENSAAAREVVKTLYKGCTTPKAFPNCGRAGRMKGRRELIFPPYIVVYQVKEHVVEISRIYHAAQDWP
jgi:toxin ParE1/3/4